MGTGSTFTRYIYRNLNNRIFRSLNLLKPVYDIARCGGSYKRMFLEKTLEEAIEHFVPNRSDSDDLRRVVNLAKSEVKRLNIEQILPPIPDIKEINEEDDDDEDSPSHMDLSPIVAELKKLEEFSIQFRVKNVGMNFEWGFFTVSKIGWK